MIIPATRSNTTPCHTLAINGHVAFTASRFEKAGNFWDLRSWPSRRTSDEARRRMPQGQLQHHPASSRTRRARTTARACTLSIPEGIPGTGAVPAPGAEDSDSDSDLPSRADYSSLESEQVVNLMEFYYQGEVEGRGSR